MSVPATPRYDAPTAAVTAARAPPETCVTLRPPAGGRSVTAVGVVVEPVDEVTPGSGMTPDGSWAGRNATSSSPSTSASQRRRVPAMPTCEAVHPQIALLHEAPLHDELCQLLSVHEWASQPAEVQEWAVQEWAVQEWAVQSFVVQEWASQLPDDHDAVVQSTPRHVPPFQLVRAADAVAHAVGFQARPKMS